VATRLLTVRSATRETSRAILVSLDARGKKAGYAAGQAAMVGLAARPVRRPYSIASAPEDVGRTGVMEFLVEVGPDGQPGPHLRGVAPGCRVAVEGPVGGFVLPRRLGRELLFVAGGTGIAPLRAMMGSALRKRRPPRITMLYSARTPKEFAFIRELRCLSRQGRIRLCMTASRAAPETWRGRRGRIRQAWIRALVRNRAPLCFLCGPESFVADVTTMLRAAGVPARNIRRERY